MRKIVYWPKKDRLVYLDEKADPDFWDRRWRAEGSAGQLGPRSEIVKVTKRHLRAGARILEGGCGRANKVKALADAGFNAVGIDFADATLQQARADYPMLDLRKGDVRSLEFDDGDFDGYWSLGVIEHFWFGYDDILSEAFRVIKPGGFLFLSTPWFSPYRRWKAKRGMYPIIDYLEEPESFYQFALSRNEIITSLQRTGFNICEWHGRAAHVSMTEDMTLFKNQIQIILESSNSIYNRLIRKFIVTLLNSFCGHSYLVVAQKDQKYYCEG